MRNPSYSTIDPETGDYRWDGPLSLEKGNHDHMPARDDAYLPGDERGHLNGSAEGGSNEKANITPQSYDVNHHGFAALEQGERDAMKSGATIDSEKVGFTNGNPFGRADTYMVNDSITYPDGHVENVNLSFTNLSYSEQQEMNDLSASLPGTFDAPNPGSRPAGMSPQEYAALMEATDEELPGIHDEYAPTETANTSNPGHGNAAFATASIAPSDNSGAVISDDGESGLSSGDSADASCNDGADASGGDGADASCDDD